jgi:hypothetical protein
MAKLRRRYVIVIDSTEDAAADRVTAAIRRRRVEWWHWVSSLWLVIEDREPTDGFIGAAGWRDITMDALGEKGTVLVLEWPSTAMPDGTWATYMKTISRSGSPTTGSRSHPRSHPRPKTIFRSITEMVGRGAYNLLRMAKRLNAAGWPAEPRAQAAARSRHATGATRRAEARLKGALQARPLKEAPA